MEAVIEIIASEVGARWTQLYSRLGLDHRGRYSIHTTHEKEPTSTQHRNCALETLRRWRQSSLKEEDEGEALKSLLTVLRKISGCEGLAERLCSEHGACAVWHSGTATVQVIRTTNLVPGRHQVATRWVMNR